MEETEYLKKLLWEYDLYRVKVKALANLVLGLLELEPNERMLQELKRAIKDLAEQLGCIYGSDFEGCGLSKVVVALEHTLRR